LWRWEERGGIEGWKEVEKRERRESVFFFVFDFVPASPPTHHCKRNECFTFILFIKAGFVDLW